MSTARTPVRPSRVSATLLDGLLLFGPPVAFLSAYLLPTSVKLDLALDYMHPTRLSLYASHFVHFRLPHLLANVLGYLLASTTAYLLALVAGERTRFRAAMLVLLVLDPLVLSVLNLAWPRPRIGYGGSGTVMGVAALVPILLCLYLGAVTDGETSVRDAAVFYFLSVAVAGAAPPLGTSGDAVAVIAALGALFYLREMSLGLDALRGLPPGRGELLVAATVVAVGYPAVAFPSDPVVSGGVLNLLVHLLGYGLAFVPAYLTPGIGTRLLVPDRIAASEP